MTELYAYVVADTEPDDEGVPAFLDPSTGTWMPMMGADRARADQLRDEAQHVADLMGKPVKLVRATGLEVVEEILPRPSRLGIFLLAYADGLSVNAWLTEYDPDGDDGAGHVRSSPDPAKALRFDGPAEAMECWRRVSTVRPTRQDGKPNRPLTAYTVEIAKLPDG